MSVSSDKIEYLAETHMSPVFQFCCFLTGNRLDAEDLCQDTFLKAMELGHKFPCSGEEREIRNYLIGISVNLWKNHQRKKKRRQRIAPTGTLDEETLNVADGKLVEEQVAEREMVKEVRAAVDQLPDKQKIVIHLFYSVGMSMEEIAVLLHIPKETVKSRLRLAKDKLRNRLEAQGYEV